MLAHPERLIRGLLATLFVAVVEAVAQPAAAQSPDSSRADSGSASSQRVPSEASPRRSVEHYLTVSRQGRFAEAARYLDLPDSLQTRGSVLARQLKAVLDRHVWIDLDDLSAEAGGDTTDGLPTLVDQIAVIDRDGRSEPVRIARTDVDGELRWQFSRSTVSRIPEWYAALDHRWLHAHLPAPLLRPGPLEILWWQWVALPLLVLIGAAIGGLTRRLIGPLVRRLVARTRGNWDDSLLELLAAPGASAVTTLAIALLVPWLGLYAPAEAAVYRTLRAILLLIVFWSLWRLIDIARQLAGRSRWALTSSSSRSLLPLGARVAKAGILAIALIATLAMLGYPVTSLVAGLGIGGLALALAAQKTVENLFGAFSIGVDQPFREGDFVKVADFVGTVEQIGLRSTRFRTLDRTLVTLPNGQLADMRLESYTARDRLRFAAMIGLVYETSASQLRDVLKDVETVLRAHPKIWPDAVVVRFSAFAESSLDIEIMAWFETTDWSEFQLIRQEILLQIMDVVERAGTSFAFPTRTVHVIDSMRPREYGALALPPRR
jgi:MscS family membrane protein